MGSAHRRESPDYARLATTACTASPHCRLPVPLALRFGGLDGLWLHYGPIGKDTTPLAVHRAERPASERNDGALEVETRQVWRGYEDCHLDMFVLNHHPGGGARKHVQALGGAREVLWRVFAVAWCDEGRTRVSWSVPGLGLPHEGYVQFAGGERPTAATQAEFDRLLNLLDGRPVRRGRPSRLQEPGWVERNRDVYERATARKGEHPGLPWNAIAEAMGMSDRQLRMIRRMFEPERVNGGDASGEPPAASRQAGLHLVNEEDA